MMCILMRIAQEGKHPHAGIRRTGSGALMDWRGGGFSAYDLVHGVITAKATARVVIAQVVMRSRDSLDGP